AVGRGVRFGQRGIQLDFRAAYTLHLNALPVGAIPQVVGVTDKDELHKTGVGILELDLCITDGGSRFQHEEPGEVFDNHHLLARWVERGLDLRLLSGSATRLKIKPSVAVQVKMDIRGVAGRAMIGQINAGYR